MLRCSDGERGLLWSVVFSCFVLSWQVSSKHLGAAVRSVTSMTVPPCDMHGCDRARSLSVTFVEDSVV